MRAVGCAVAGLGGTGASDVPEGVNAERGNLGNDFGHLRRWETPGEGGVREIQLLVMAEREREAENQ
jgi:hypothetical protein